jgi:death-on-curing protein
LDLGIKGALESALKRPFQSFEGSDLYPDVVEKAAALIESILTNHPFIDGNKRTGYVLMRLYLIENDKDVLASQEEKYEFVMNIASGKLKLQEIVEWLSTHTSS